MYTAAIQKYNGQGKFQHMNKVYYVNKCCINI